LYDAGICVVFGSRKTTKPKGCENRDISIISVEQALDERLIILAVPAFVHDSLPGKDKMTEGTVVVDCSNNSSQRRTEAFMSQAEQLQLTLPEGVHVVKAFNTISAYQLEQGPEGFVNHFVPVASDSQAAKEIVSQVLTKLGLNMVDYGTLASGASTIEQLPLSFFPQWKAPLAISTLLWFFMYLITFSRYHLCEHGSLSWNGKGLSKMALKYVNKTCDSHALTLLAACYLPGIIAAYLQLFKGTKYQRFPSWLDNWLKMRKQLGLLMLLSASIHACIYVLVFTEHLESTWQANIFVTSGVLAYFVAVILGVTSLPSVSSSLSWTEFRRLQSWLGWACLILSTIHVLCSGWSRLLTWRYCLFPSSVQMPLVLPILTVLLKVPLILPPVDSRLNKIRQGIVRES